MHYLSILVEEGKEILAVDFRASSNDFITTSPRVRIRFSGVTALKNHSEFP